MKSPGDRVREFRKEMGMTQEALGKYYGRPKNWIKNRERGGTRINVSFLMVLYENFKLSPNWVLLGVEPKFLTGNYLVDIYPESCYYDDASF